MTQQPPERPAGGLDDQLAARLLSQRIIVLGQEVDDQIAKPAVRRAAPPVCRGPAPRLQPLHQLTRRLGRRGARHLRHHAADPERREHPGARRRPEHGAVPAVGRDAGQALCASHSRVLLHQGSAGIGGTAVDIEIQAEHLEHTKNVVIGLIAEHTGQPADKVERDARRDRWFTAEQARDTGSSTGC